VPVRGIVLLIFVIGSLPVCFMRPFYGIALWTIFAFANPQQLIWGAADAFPWAVAIGVATIAGYLVFNRSLGGRTALPHLALLALLWTWFLITSIISTHVPMLEHHTQDTWYRFDFVSKILLMTVVLIGLVDSFERLRILVKVIAGCFAFFVLKALPFIALAGGAYRVFGPEHTMIGDNNDFGLAIDMTVPLFFFIAQTESGRWSKLFWGFTFIASIPIVFFTYSRGAMIGLAAVLCMMLLRLKQRLIIVPVVAAGIALALLFAPSAWKERMDPTREGAIDASAKSRLNAWTFSWRLANDFPIAGGGFETFSPELFQRYAPNVADVHGPHSVYFGVLAEHGFVGLALYLALVGSCFVTVRRIRKRARMRGDRVIANYAMMFQFSLVGFLTAGLFLGRAYFDYFFTIVGCIVILKRVAMTEWAEEEPAADVDAMVVA
jgi:probable O-glycosylation ligase (exosortase A-associated)